MIITNTGMLIRMPARDISVIGRNTQGVRLIDIGEAEELVVGLTRVAAEEAAGEAAAASAAGAEAPTNGKVEDASTDEGAPVSDGESDGESAAESDGKPDGEPDDGNNPDGGGDA
jgi:DNA gyrase subunit A